jgi:hypothetical protein
MQESIQLPHTQTCYKIQIYWTSTYKERTNLNYDQLII